MGDLDFKRYTGFPFWIIFLSCRVQGVDLIFRRPRAQLYISRGGQYNFSQRNHGRNQG